MAKNKREKYEKPRLTEIKLDAQTAVLGKCKNTAMVGPNGANCGVPFPICRVPGS